MVGTVELPVVEQTLLLPYNDVDAVRELCDARGSEIAALIVEPVAGNMGMVPPVPGFREGLREITEQHGIVLIFDEVITGFRVAYGGAQAFYGVTPDLTTLGKIIGGGLPVGAYGGRAEIVDAVRKIMEEGIPPKKINEQLFDSYLYTAGLPAVDLLIRTAGEFRISNFLIWQTAYSEYYFAEVFWPDFDAKEIDKALLAYSRRQRRFGAL